MMTTTIQPSVVSQCQECGAELSHAGCDRCIVEYHQRAVESLAVARRALEEARTAIHATDEAYWLSGVHMAGRPIPAICADLGALQDDLTRMLARIEAATGGGDATE